jgi:heme-degrading monooxygenase HmoA
LYKNQANLKMIAKTPVPPYYAVIFTSIRTDEMEDYGITAQKMVEMAAEQPGFLGVESARNDIGITVSYWSSLEAIRLWKQVTAHRAAQSAGREKWYSAYKTRICLVERDYEFSC